MGSGSPEVQPRRSFNNSGQPAGRVRGYSSTQSSTANRTTGRSTQPRSGPTHVIQVPIPSSPPHFFLIHF